VTGGTARSLERLVLHFTHVRNLQGILAAGCLQADSHVDRRSALAVEAADLAIKDSRRAIAISLPPFGCVADYVPFYFAPRVADALQARQGGCPNLHRGTGSAQWFDAHPDETSGRIEAVLRLITGFASAYGLELFPAA
jgi:hypothetical protein